MAVRDPQNLVEILADSDFELDSEKSEEELSEDSDEICDVSSPDMSDVLLIYR